MCTLSWCRDVEGWQVFFNRDENRTRRPGEPPRLDVVEGVQILAPRDGDAGGAWIGANEYGLGLALLNRYEDRHPDGDEGAFRSRGRVVLELLDSRSGDEVRGRLEGGDLTDVQPFTLVAFDSNPEPLAAEWTGRTLRFERMDDDAQPLSSSGYDDARAKTERRMSFTGRVAQGHGLGRDAATHLEFHRSHEPEQGPYSVCMHREEASTVSFSRLVLERTRVRVQYQEGPPCEARPAKILTLDRVSVTPEKEATAD